MRLRNASTWLRSCWNGKSRSWAAKAANPRAARALLYLGKAYAQQGRLGDAEANLREALTFFEKQPNTKGLNYNLYAQIARDLLAGIPDSA